MSGLMNGWRRNFIVELESMSLSDEPRIILNMTYANKCFANNKVNVKGLCVEKLCLTVMDFCSVICCRSLKSKSAKIAALTDLTHNVSWSSSVLRFSWNKWFWNCWTKYSIYFVAVNIIVFSVFHYLCFNLRNCLAIASQWENFRNFQVSGAQLAE